jgi:branched-chain amino acid transport system ATP-binding protein
VTSVIAADALSVGYSGQAVVRDLTLAVKPGEIVCLLGPNGAGKTTTMLGLTGELPPISGRVLFDGVPASKPLYRRARTGLAYVPEERSVFKSMSARDNLRIGGVDPNEAVRLFPELEPRLGVRGGLLSGGEQQMLTLARALARRPRVLLADELSLGLAPLMVERLLQALRDAADQDGSGVLIVEQHAHKALKYADRAVVMRRGRIVLALSAAEARARFADVQRAYLTSGDNGDHAD